MVGDPRAEEIDLIVSVESVELLGMEETTLALAPDGDPVTIELPEVRARVFTAHSVLATGHAILFGGRDAHRDDPWVVVRAEPVVTP